MLPTKPVKILITGTFESGKSTLLSQFQEDERAIVIPEVAHDLLQNDPSLELKPGFQDLNFAEQLRRESEAELVAIKTGRRIILCDRGVLDTLAYCEVLRITPKQEWLDASINRYSKAIILSKEDIPHISNNPTLDIDLSTYRNNLDTAIRKFLSIYNPDFIEIDGPMVQRVNKLRECIKTSLVNVEGNQGPVERRT